MSNIDPTDIPRPRAGRDPGLRVTAPTIRDPRPAAMGQFADTMRSISGTFKALHEQKTGLEDDAFLDNYALEFTQRSSTAQEEMLNSDLIAQPDFIDQFDQRMVAVQEETFSALEERGYKPSDEGRQRAVSYAMDRRITGARTASVGAHNQRVMTLYDDAESTVQSIARMAGGSGDLEAAYAWVDRLEPRLSKVLAPDKVRDFRNAARVQVTRAAILGHIEREEYDAAQAIIDRETGFAAEGAPEVMRAIVESAKAGGVDPALALAIASVESGFDPTAENAGSSAAGIFQITDATAESLGLDRDALLSEQVRAGITLTNSNIGILRRALGTEPDMAEVYLAHVLGAGDAIDVMESDGDTPLSELLTEEVLKANPQFEGLTASGLYAWAAGKMKQGLEVAGKALEGREGSLAPAGVPLSQIPSLGRAVAEGNDAKRAEYKRLVADDVASLRETGQPLEINPEEAARYLTPEQYATWRDDRVTAQTYHSATTDMYRMTEREIAATVDALTPPPGARGYDRALGLQEQVRKEADRIVKERVDDPAKAVSRSPEVAEAEGAFAEIGMEGLIRARLEAQARVGIPADVMAPLKKAEMERFVRFIKNAPDALVPERLQFVFADFEENYGVYADEAAVQFMGAVGNLPRDAADTAATLLRKVIAGEPITRQQTASLDDAMETNAIRAAAESFSSQVSPYKVAGYDIWPGGGNLLRMVPDWMLGDRVRGLEPQEVPVPSEEHIRLIMEKPDEYLPDFIKTFGPNQVPPTIRARIPRDILTNE